LLRQLSGFVSRHLSIIQSGRHKQWSSQHTLARQKNIQKTSVFAAKDNKKNKYAMIRQDTGIRSLTGIIKPVPVGNHEFLKHECHKRKKEKALRILAA
jgi:hypothetical protein